MALKALLFDVDGTMADTEEAHRWAFNNAFAEFNLGWVWDSDLYGELLAIAGGKERISHYLKRIGSEKLTHFDIDVMIANIHQRKNQIYAELLAEGNVPFRPGVERLIREAHTEGILLGIATTTSTANITALFKNTVGIEMLGWFDAVGAGGHVENLKPAPDIYRMVLGVMGLQVNECLAIEDSANGLRACMGAGINTVVTTTAYTKNQDFCGAVAVLENLGEADIPCNIQHGELFDKSYVDIDLLRRWHKH